MRNAQGVASMLESTDDADTPAGSEADPRWELIERIAATAGFARSGRLRDFLRYIGRQAINGRAEELSEHSIGVSVFHRSSSYDCSVDGIVRAHAVRLRSKLAEYFKDDGKDEPLRLTIPKGGYVPVFTPVRPEVLEPADAMEPGSSEDRFTGKTDGVVHRPRGLWLSISTYMVLATVVGLLGAALLRRDAWLERSFVPSTTADRFWTELFSGDRATLIVPGDNGLVLFENLTGETVSLHTYLSDFRPKQPLYLYGKSQALIAANLSWRRITTVVDLEITTDLEKLPEAANRDTKLVFARDLSLDELGGRNLIFIGADEANPWVELYQPLMNFTLENDAKKHVFVVQNRAPGPAEINEYLSNTDDPHEKVYGLIAYLPNINGAGKVLLLEGTSQAGTQAAAQFVLNNPRLTAFLHTLRQSRQAVPYFELLLESDKFADRASGSKIVAYRVH